MAWMSNEQYEYVQDCKDKKVTARSARHARTHNGKGGSVKFPSDYMSAKELKSMNSECKTYRMNEPMTWDEFKAMPDDLKISYVKGLREKFRVPACEIAMMMGVNPPTFNKYLRCLGIAEGRGSSGNGRGWDREGFEVWRSGFISETLVNENCKNTVEATVETVEADVSVSEDVEESSKINEEKSIEDPVCYTGHRMPVIPKSGTFQFMNNYADDALDTIRCLLSNTRVNLTISWECVFDE